MPTNVKPKFSKFYFPGMISLVGIPLICIFLFFDRTSQRFGRLEFITISKQNLIESDKLRFPLNTILKASRNYSHLSFSGNQTHDNNERKDLLVTIRKLITKKDTINGLAVELGSNSKYVDLVNIVDLFHLTKNENIVYTFYNNTFYIKYMNFANTFMDNTPKMPL